MPLQVTCKSFCTVVQIKKINTGNSAGFFGKLPKYHQLQALFLGLLWALIYHCHFHHSAPCMYAHRCRKRWNLCIVFRKYFLGWQSKKHNTTTKSIRKRASQKNGFNLKQRQCAEFFSVKFLYTIQIGEQTLDLLSKLKPEICLSQSSLMLTFLWWKL